MISLENKVFVSSINSEGINVSINDKNYFLPFSRYPWFRYCSVDELMEVSTDGIGIYWDKADIELELEMINDPHKEVNILSLDKWLEYRLKNSSRKYGRIGGSARTSAKLKASRDNGRKGGRPKKAIPHTGCLNKKKLVHA
ncbi:MAG: DUF2442 domain-containing protein [Lentisphaerota bacterium]